MACRKPSDRAATDGRTRDAAFDTEWQRKQFEGGWAGISWPKEYGGRGLSLVEQLIWHEEYARAHAPWVGSCFVGLNHGGPTLIARGREEQKVRHLPSILRGDEIWCQGFSEPGAGSDLASLRTRGVIEGDELVVNGQKIWTSFAPVADFQELLVRTDPAAPKHKGITWVICDMTAPGIEIREIRAMSGKRQFAEVFYDNVRIPLSNVVGEINDGWSVAMSTLGFERGTAFMSEQVELAEKLESLVELARGTVGPDGRRPAIADDEIAGKLSVLRAEVNGLRAMTYMTVSRARSGPLDSRSSITRLFFAEIQKRMRRLALDIVGDEFFEPDSFGRTWPFQYYDGFRYTIAAGTSEVQRNIIGERVLGLPRAR